MAHRHRHPEDQKFFRRLEQLFHVLEDEEAQPTRAGNPRPSAAAETTEQAYGDPYMASGVPHRGDEAQPTPAGNSHTPTPAGTAQAHGDPTAACPSVVLRGGGALGEIVNENGIANAGKGNVPKEDMTLSPRSHGAVDVAIRVVAPPSCENAAKVRERERGAAAAAGAGAGAGAASAATPTPAAPFAASASDDAAAAGRVAGKAIAADSELKREARNDRGGKCDGADVRIFCIWSRQGNV